MVHVLPVLAFAFPLGLDTFARSAALGIAGGTGHKRLRASVILTSFEAGKPFAGFVIGSCIGTATGSASDYAAAAVLVAVVALPMLRLIAAPTFFRRRRSTESSR